MRLSFVLIIALFSMVSPSDLRAETDPSIQRLVESYRAQPCPKKDVGGSSGPSRLRVLESLASMSDQAVSEIAGHLVGEDLPDYRPKLIEALGHIPTTSSADILISLMLDPDPMIRRKVIQSIRQLASRIDRRGLDPVPREATHGHIEGLIPHLITAAGDEDWCNRRLALYALAYTGTQEAAAEIRRRLKDPVSSVSRDRALERCFA